MCTRIRPLYVCPAVPMFCFYPTLLCLENLEKHFPILCTQYNLKGVHMTDCAHCVSLPDNDTHSDWRGDRREWCIVSHFNNLIDHYTEN